MTDARSTLPKMLAVAVVLELTLLRLATRTFVNVPGLDVMRGPLRVVAGLGRVSYFVSVVALAATAAWLGSRVGWNLRASPASILPLLVLIAAGGAWAGLVPEPALALVAISSLLALGLVAATRPRRRLPVVALVAAASIGGGALAFQGPGTTQGLVEGALTVSEWSWAVWGIGAPLLFRGRLWRGSFVIGGSVALLTALWMATPASPFDILVLWAFGLTGSIPAWVFGIATGGLVASVVESIRRRRWALMAGLVCAAAAGVSLPSSYQSVLLVTGVSLLVVGERRVRGAPHVGAQRMGGRAHADPDFRLRVLSPRTFAPVLSSGRRSTSPRGDDDVRAPSERHHEPRTWHSRSL